jgi:hypothetical protein
MQGGRTVIALHVSEFDLRGAPFFKHTRKADPRFYRLRRG